MFRYSIEKENYFDLFKLEETFEIDLEELDEKYFVLQREFHPDRFVTKSGVEKLAGLEKSTRLNEAYEVLKEPLYRAEYILFLRGRIVNTEEGSELPCPMLLIEAMDQRETLSEADSIEKIQKIEAKSSSDRVNCLDNILKNFRKNNLDQVVQSTMRLKYLDKLNDEIRIKRLHVT